MVECINCKKREPGDGPKICAIERGGCGYVMIPVVEEKKTNEPLSGKRR